MDVLTQVMDIIGNSGFPIALCVYILHLKEKRDDKHDEREKEFAAAMQETAKALTEMSTILREKGNE